MKFSTRLLLSAVVPALMFFTALGASQFGLFRTEQDFADLMAREQKLASGFAELYGHGLQAGQALRNILLDPANLKAYDNLKTARKAYDKAYQELGTVAAGTAFEAPTRALAELGAAQSAAQDTVLALAR